MTSATDTLTIGVEEEFQLVARRSKELASGYDALMRHATPEISKHMRPGGEDRSTMCLRLVCDSMEQLGTADHMAHLRYMLTDGYLTGSERQIRAYERRNRLSDVRDMLVSETMKGIDLSTALPLAPRRWFPR